MLKTPTIFVAIVIAMVSYALMGTLAGAEYLVRRRVQRKENELHNA